MIGRFTMKAATCTCIAVLLLLANTAQPSTFLPDEGTGPLPLIQSLLAKAQSHEVVFLDDMAFDPEQLSRSGFHGPRWTNGDVYYAFDPALTATQRAQWLAAAAAWSAVADVRFAACTWQPNYIHVFDGGGNWSYVGMIGGSQDMSIHDWDQSYVIAHEIAHALGAGHEHQRTDRDPFIAVNVGNIQPAYRDQFSEIEMDLYGEYDFYSLMHYDQCAFSIDCPPGCTCDCTAHVITCLPPYEEFQNLIGQQHYLSWGDATGMCARYNTFKPQLASQSLAPDPAVGGARADTVWFGGYNEVEQRAYNSVDDGYETAVWTWDAGTVDPLEGWTSFDLSCMVGGYMNICTEGEWQGFILGPPSVGGRCDLSGNALYCATDIPTSPRPGHESGHHEYMISPIIDREGFTSGAGYFDVVGRWDTFYYLPWSRATFYRPGAFYYPYTTEEDPTPRWSERSGQAVWHYTGQTPICMRRETFSLSAPVDGTPLPANWERMQLILEVMTDCDGFGIPAVECRNEGVTNGAPIYDNVRVGITGGVNAPPIVLETGHLFHDGFGQTLPTFLDAGDVCNADVAYDLSLGNAGNNDWLADTAVVTGPLVTLPEYKYWVDLCFRVAKKGPRQDWIPGYSAWKARLGGNPEEDYVCALMDTAMTQAGWHWVPVQEGRARVTYFHESDWGFDPNHADRTPEQEILPDRIFTPGTRIEYYYRSYWSTDPQGYFTIPTNAPEVTVNEMEFLPMMELDFLTPAQYDVIWPSVLYIDAFNVGAETYITPVLDQALGVGMYDKLDRQNFSSNYDAPLLRSFGRAWYNPGGYGNNGCTLSQLLGYRLILFNSGTYGIGGVEIEDFTILENWLTAIDCGLPDVRRGLVMNGDEIASIMADPIEGKAVPFANNTLGVALIDRVYRDYNNDDYGCVWLIPSGWGNNEFDPLGPIAVYGNDSPRIYDYNVLGVQAGSRAEGNLDFQPGAGAYGYNYPYVEFSQVVKEENITGGGGWKTVVDGFSWHHLSEIGYGGEECSRDTVAVRAGCADLLIPELAWFINDTRAQAFTKWNYPCTDVSVEDGETHLSGPVDFLYASRPNPFRGTATIRFTLASEGPVKIAIYDVSGRLVRTLCDGKAPSGENALTWDGYDNAGDRASGGIYWMEMTTPRYQSARRLVALR
jgi:hypothetical protein